MVTSREPFRITRLAMSSGASPGPLGAVSLGLRGLQEGRKNAKTLKGKSGEGSRDISFTTSWGGGLRGALPRLLGKACPRDPDSLQRATERSPKQ